MRSGWRASECASARRRAQRRVFATGVAVIAPFLGAACGGTAAEPSYVVVARIPHDRSSFTQGLVVEGDHFWESTGLVGSSSVRKLDRVTGAVRMRTDVPAPYFAEGLALMNRRLHLLTWRNGTSFVYDPVDLSRKGEFPLEGEGWGLASHGDRLVLSDGTSRLRFLSPTDHSVVGSISVTDRGMPVSGLNELESVRGEIWANIWKLDRIARIDPSTGRVVAWLDLPGLLPASERQPGTDVLNGIAYDSAEDKLYVTGKRWPWIYEIKTPALPARGR